MRCRESTALKEVVPGRSCHLGSFLKQLWAITRLRAKRLARRKVAWDALGSALKESMVRGATAKSLVLSKFGRLPTRYAPQRSGRVKKRYTFSIVFHDFRWIFGGFSGVNRRFELL